MNRWTIMVESEPFDNLHGATLSDTCLLNGCFRLEVTPGKDSCWIVTQQPWRRERRRFAGGVAFWSLEGDRVTLGSDRG